MSPRRENSSRRRAPTRQARSLLVLCGGRRTEPDYLDGLRQMQRRTDLKVRLVATGRDPSGLVRHAGRMLQHDRAEFDEVWCVVDVDDFVLTGAERAAASAGVDLAVSNPCFEVWLLLHFDDCGSHVDGAEDADRRLTRHLPSYDKTRLAFADFAPRVGVAVDRARALDTGSITGPNPSSGVWRLVEKMVS